MRGVVGMIGLAMITSIVALGCAPQSEVVKLYDDPDRASKTFKRLLIIDISSDRSQQQLFEDEITRKLRAENVDAVSSYTLLDSSRGLLQDDVDRVSEQVGADGILVTHMASVGTRAEKVEGREDIRSTCRGGDLVDYFLYDHEVIREPDSVRLADTVIVITNLYDAASRSRVWTIQSTCFDMESIADVLRDESDAIVRQLRIDELI